MSSDSSDLTAVVPRHPRKRRDERLRRLARAIRHNNPHLAGEPGNGPLVGRLSRLYLLGEIAFERARAAAAGDDVATFLAATESYRRLSDSSNRLEQRLGIGSRTSQPIDLAAELARAISGRRRAEIAFAPAASADNPDKPGDIEPH
jgi:hypothetical protein